MRTFTILGPSHSGKSTLAGALASLDAAGARLDVADGVSVHSFSYLGEPWCAFDVPGGTEAMHLAGGAIAASDAAVLCVPPDPESAPLVAPYLRLIETAGVPCFLFINKMDMVERRLRDTVAALQVYASHAIVLRQVPIRQDGHVAGAVDLISERAWEYHEGAPSSLVEIPQYLLDREQAARTELLEHMADFDDALLEQLIEDKRPATEELYDLIANLHRHNELIPACLGAAAHQNGITRLMKSLRHEAPTFAETTTRLGLDDKILSVALAGEQRRHVGKAVVLRALSDGLAQGSSVGGGPIGGLVDLDGKPVTGPVAAGEIAVAVRSDHLSIATAQTAEAQIALPDWSHGPSPTFRRTLVPANDRDDARLSTALQKLIDVDMGLRTEQDPDTGHAILAAQGPVHFRRVVERLETDFSIEVTTEEVAGQYRETISRSVDQHYRHRKQSGGAGQFADVHLTVVPRPRGSGFEFNETVKGGAVPRNYIPAVEHGAVDALAKGPLGFQVIDVGVTLTDGKHHSVDSSDFAFRTAGTQGVREALREAGPVLLQPIDSITIHVPSVYAGSLVALISTLKGQVLGFDPHPTSRGWDVFRATIPAPAHAELLRSLMALTQGTAWYETAFDHYEELHGKEAERVCTEKAEATA